MKSCLFRVLSAAGALLMLLSACSGVEAGPTVPPDEIPLIEQSLPSATNFEQGERWYERPILLGYDSQKPLNGMLTLPNDVKNPPVAILLQGSGRNSMDSPIGKSKNLFFADLAHGLAEQGIATIRYDKRSFAYPDDVIDIETEYLNDVKAAVRFALEEELVNGDALFLIGHSQGGMLAPKIVSDNPKIKGFVSMGGTLRRLEDMVLEQTHTRMEQDVALTQAEKDAQIAAVQADVQRIKALTTHSDASTQELIQGYPETYWKSLNQIDSLTLTGQLSAQHYPMLILQGINDFQVTHETDYLLWEKTVSDNENAQCIAYDGLSHVFMPGSKDRFDGSVYDPPAHVDPQVIEDIAEWIKTMRDKK